MSIFWLEGKFLPFFQVEYSDRVQQLEREAARLSSLFGNTRVETKNAVEAANGYKELSDLLKKARSLAQEASSNANEAKNFAELEKVDRLRTAV